MLQRLKSIITYRNLYLFSLILIATGLAVSKPLIILGQMCLAALWLITGNYKEKLKNFAQNKMALVLSSLFLISIVGLINTSDFDYAFGDLRRKLHLFLLPFFVASFPPLSSKEVKLVFHNFLFWIVFSSLWSMVFYLGIAEEQILDKRQLSRYHSHIRFGLEVCLAIFGSVYYFVKNKEAKYKWIWLLVAIWLFVFLFLMGMFTGIIVFIITSIVLLVVLSFSSSNNIIKYGFLILVTSIIAFSIYFVITDVNKYLATKDVEPLPKLEYSPSGEKYAHDISTVRQYDKENGYIVWKNIAWGEIKAEWNKRSKIDFDGMDLKGQKLTTTLIRFLTSKGEIKNAEAIKKLTESEQKAVEQGVSNVNFLNDNVITRRLHKIFWEFDNYYQGRDYNGHSVVMRWEYAKIAISTIKENWLIGVGTGDVRLAFDSYYEKNNSILLPKYRRRAHNQFLTYTVTFGVIGGLWFLIVLVYPILVFKSHKNYLYLALFCISFLSMLSEDTLETLVGIVYFIFFSSIFLLQKTKN